MFGLSMAISTAVAPALGLMVMNKFGFRPLFVITSCHRSSMNKNPEVAELFDGKMQPEPSVMPLVVTIAREYGSFEKNNI